MVAEFAEQHGYRADLTQPVVSLNFPDRPGGLSSASFAASSHHLVVSMTHGKGLGHQDLAQATAVANAWNTAELVPMLSVWNLRGDRPYLAGVCTLPLTWQVPQQDFDRTVSFWIEKAQRMFTWCDETFGL